MTWQVNGSDLYTATCADYYNRNQCLPAQIKHPIVYFLTFGEGKLGRLNTVYGNDTFTIDPLDHPVLITRELFDDLNNHMIVPI